MRNLTMLTDLYELTMMYGYWKKGMGRNRAVFDTVSYTHLDVYKRQDLYTSWPFMWKWVSMSRSAA